MAIASCKGFSGKPRMGAGWVLHRQNSRGILDVEKKKMQEQGRPHPSIHKAKISTGPAAKQGIGFMWRADNQGLNVPYGSSGQLVLLQRSNTRASPHIGTCRL